MLILCFLTFFAINTVLGNGSVVPILALYEPEIIANASGDQPLKYLQFITLMGKRRVMNDNWRGTEMLSLLRSQETDEVFGKCEESARRKQNSLVHIPSMRSVQPICISPTDFQLCPQCSHFNNETECELFRDSCKERRIRRSEYGTYCTNKYGKWRTMFLPADYTKCRCCDECIFYRELDQSCMEDEYNFDADEFLPVTTIDFRAGCNRYWGHPEQTVLSLTCDKFLRRCVRAYDSHNNNNIIPNETMNFHLNYRYKAPQDGDCPFACRGYECPKGTVSENRCPAGAFLPDSLLCNCCGRCSSYQQLNQKCAEIKTTIQQVNGSKEIEIEEELLEPGCDDGLVCRQGTCQDIHKVPSPTRSRRKRDDAEMAYEPCKQELKLFKKKYGPEGHLHFNAPQCTPLWLYAPVQCRRFVCYCALEDGTFIKGIQVPRVEVSNMNCDCAREKCRTGSMVKCDGYGNYDHKEVLFVNQEKGGPDADNTMAKHK